MTLSHLSLPTVLVASVALIGLAGCSSSGGGGSSNQAADPTTQSVQDTAAASTMTSDLFDVGTETVAGGVNDSAPSPAMTALVPSFDTVAGERVVDLATVTNPDGSKRYPNTVGSVRVKIEGTSTTSAPAGLTKIGAWTVQVFFDQGDVVTTDPVSGTKAAIAGGSGTAATKLQYNLDTQFTATALRNWTLAMEATYAVDPALSVTVIRTDGTAKNHTLTGMRHVLHQRQRGPDASGDDVVQTARTIDGDATGVNPTEATERYTRWLVTRTGDGKTLLWNRHAEFTWGWNYTKKQPIETTKADRIFITIDGGEKLGPFTPAQVATRFRVRKHSEGL